MSDTHPADTIEGAPVQWRIDGFDPEQPFTAALVIEDGDTSAAMTLDPATVALLAPALNWVRSAQRAVVLGEPVPHDVTAATAVTDDTTPDPAVSTDADTLTAPDRKRTTRGKVVLLSLGVIVTACVIYALAVGAVLI